MAGAQANIRNFYAPLKGPGRSAPTLLEDLILYDPKQSIKNGYNILEHGAQGAEQAQFINPLLAEGSCLHNFCLKKRQSLLPAHGERADPNTVWQAAAVCRRCRIHLLLKVDYSVAWQDEPCPQWEHPLHHLLRSTWRTEAWARDLVNDGNYMDEVHVYECSSPKCSAIVSVQLSTPIFTDDALHQLIDKELLANRARAAFEQKKGQTEGMKWPLPIDVLNDLRAYIKNAWRKDAQTEIDLNNKRFVVRFGPDGSACGDVLEMLGFEFKPGKSWIVPRPDNKEPIPIAQTENIFLDNVEAELDVLMANRPQEERETIRDTTVLEPATLALARVLSCQDYDVETASRTVRRPLDQRPRPFTLLGIPEAASDDLVIWAYRRQMALLEDDPKNTAKLMTALEEIQQARQSEALTQQLAIEQSLGRFGERTVLEAYRSLGLYANPSLDDEVIIGTFNSRISDAPAQEAEMRQSLLTLGEFRKSKRLVDFARKAITSYEDALSFLGAESNTDDSFLSSMFTDKASNSASDREMAQKALQIIADYRKSDSLQSFITSGYQGEILQSHMDVGEAFALLEVEDRTIDDESLYVVYEFRLGDEPAANHARLRKAMETIAEEKNSGFLKEKMNMPPGERAVSSQQLLSEPIGLDNIGNTCYLNSLLQWLFTIVSVRKIVLDYDEYRQIADELHTKTKRVGHREVKPKEVQNAQKFVEQLAELFRQMIESPYRTVRPAQELARRTLEIQDVTARRSSTLIQAPRRGTLGTLDGRQVFGPLPPPMEMTENEQPLQSPEELAAPGADPMNTSTAQSENQLTMITKSSAQEEYSADSISEITLVSAGDRTTNGDVEMKDSIGKSKTHSSTSGDSPVLVSIEETEDLIQSVVKPDLAEQSTAKENSAVETSTPNAQDPKPPNDMPTEAEAQKDTTMTDVNSKPPSRTVSPEPIRAKEQNEAPEKSPVRYLPPPGPPPSKLKGTNEYLGKEPVKYLPPPGPPPPVPPRKPAASAVTTSTLEQYARQQDVTEVLEYVIHQLSCAVRPTGIGRNGEQQDEIHDSFHGETQEHKVEQNDTISHREPEQFLFHQTQISNEPKDLYAALDNYFDLEDRGTIKIYNTIAKLPPVLCLALGRAVHDYKTGQNVKINCHVDIPNTLFMDRYLDAPPYSVLATRRKQKWAYKEELCRLRYRIGQLEPQGRETVDEALSAAVAAVQHLTEVAATEDIQILNMPPAMINDMAELARKTREERLEIKNRIILLEQQLNDSFTDAMFRKEEYKLHAAFFHRGSAGSGHYWIYIFDHVNEIWRKYNDDIVTQVANLQEIFGNPRDQGNPFYSNAPNSNPPNPYFLVYVRSDHLKSAMEDHEPIVETLKREPIVLPPEVQPQRETISTNGNTDYESAPLRSLTDDSPTYNDPSSSHHEWSGYEAQQSQMTYMPPDAPPIQSQESSGREHGPHKTDTSENFANIGSVVHKRDGPGPGQIQGGGAGAADEDEGEDDENETGVGDEMDWQTRQAIAQSLKPQKPEKVGEWDDRGGRSTPPDVVW